MLLRHALAEVRISMNTLIPRKPLSPFCKILCF
jgi:hypothetical protein